MSYCWVEMAYVIFSVSLYIGLFRGLFQCKISIWNCFKQAPLPTCANDVVGENFAMFAAPYQSTLLCPGLANQELCIEVSLHGDSITKTVHMYQHRITKFPRPLSIAMHKLYIYGPFILNNWYTIHIRILYEFYMNLHNAQKGWYK